MGGGMDDLTFYSALYIFPYLGASALHLAMQQEVRCKLLVGIQVQVLTQILFNNLDLFHHIVYKSVSSQTPAGDGPNACEMAPPKEVRTMFGSVFPCPSANRVHKELVPVQFSRNL